jgi:hypothetical protein
VNQLEIVGYAEVLKETMLPSVVPPVFRLKTDPGRALLPPYSFSGGYLCNATEVAPPELEALRDAREITLFDSPLQAQPGYELWVDQRFAWHYEPRAQVDKTLGQIATDSITQAEAALNEGKLEQAERLCSVAISAHDTRVEPLAIKAAIRRMQGNTTGESVMAELAAPVLEEKLFTLLVTDYCVAARGSTRRVPSPHPRRPMQGIAREKAAA